MKTNSMRRRQLLRAAASVIMAFSILSMALACARPPTPATVPSVSVANVNNGATPAHLLDRGAIEAHRDEFRQRSMVRARFVLAHRIELVLAFDPERPSDTAMLLVVDSFEWRCLRNREVLALVDGTPWSMPPFNRDSDTYRGGVTETLSASMPPEAFDAFAGALRVRFRVCGDEVELNPAQRDTLRRFAQQRRQPLDPDASSTAPTATPESPARADVANAMRRLQEVAATCLPVGVHQLRLTYVGDGSLVRVEADSEAVPAAAITCVQEHARAVLLPRFTRPEFTVSYPFRNQ